MLAKRQLSELVYDAVQLEGINFTLPEIQTLLEGISVGGHKLSDERIATNQADAWRFLFKALESDEFKLTKCKVLQIHEIAAKEEALTWGEFRTGSVTIAGTDYMPPPASHLDRLFDEMIEDLAALDDIYDQAIHLFLTMARMQFFYDVNKRMGRFMMNAHLLDHGFPAINLPSKRRLEFNQLMLRFYDSNDQTEMNSFLRDCIDPRVIRIMKEF